MKRKELTLNRAQCKECKDIITSYHVHDFVYCKCRTIAVDGGLEYARRVGELDCIIDMCEYKEDENDKRNASKPNIKRRLRKLATERKTKID